MRSLEHPLFKSGGEWILAVQLLVVLLALVASAVAVHRACVGESAAAVRTFAQTVSP